MGLEKNQKNILFMERNILLLLGLNACKLTKSNLLKSIRNIFMCYSGLWGLSCITCAFFTDFITTNMIILMIPLAVSILPLQILMLVQLFRMFKLKDSYFITIEYSIVGILFPVFIIPMCVAVFCGLHGYIFTSEHFKVKYIITILTLLFTNFVSYVAILCAVYIKNTLPSNNLKEFENALNYGLLKNLKRQLALDFCIEYHDFLMDYPKLTPQELYEKYVKNDAEKELNLSFTTREKLKKRLHTLQIEDFDDVKHEVILLIYTNSYTRYLKQ